MYQLDDLLHLMARLRDPQHGCPWDLQQDWRSIVPHTIEEAYEVADVIERASFADNAIKYEATLGFINGSVKTMLDSIKGTS